MKKIKGNILLAMAVFAAGSLFAVDAKDDVTAAAKKLGEADNYSWKTVVDAAGGFGSGESDGKTDKDGTIWFSTTFGDNTIESVKKGTKGAIKGEDGWQSLEEAANEQGPGRFMAGRIQTMKAPADEVQDMVSKVKELKSADGAYSGDLTEDGAKSLMTFGRRGGGQPAPQVTGAKGSVKFWVKDGALVKYEIKSSGKMSFNDNDFDIDRTTTVEIKDVGKTKVTIPDDAKKKLM